MKKIVLMIISFLTISLNAQKKETYDTEDFLIQYPVTWELQTETNTPLRLQSFLQFRMKICFLKM